MLFCEAQSQVDVEKLFHANPPSLSPKRPANAEASLSQQSNDPANAILSEVFDDDLKPYRGSRHDEFDYALTKVFQFNTDSLPNYFM